MMLEGCLRQTVATARLARIRAMGVQVLVVALVGLLNPVLVAFALEDAFLVRDLYPGSNSSNPAGLVVFGGKVYFAATDGVSGVELYMSDGTNAGTLLVRDIWSGANSSGPASLISMSSFLFFVANDGIAGLEPFASTGAAGNAVRLMDIRPGATGSNPSSARGAGNKVYFTADDGSSGVELYVTDGTPAGTLRPRDIRPGATGSTPTVLTAFGNRVVFAANDGTTGNEPWVSDGTNAGTFLLRNIRTTGPGGGNSDPSNMAYVPALGFVFFDANDQNPAGRELWRTDGTTVGTVLVADIRPGSQNSNPTNLTSAGSRLYFAANDGNIGVEPWISDGTSAGTVSLGNINPGAANSNPSNFFPVGGLVFFVANGPGGNELYVTNGTPAGTQLVKDIFPGPTASNPSNFQEFGGKLFFTANDGTSGNEPYVSDGTTAGTYRLADINSGVGNSDPQSIVAANFLYFTADDGVAGREPWRTDGTTAGTMRVTDIRVGAGSSTPTNPVIVGDFLIFNATDGPGASQRGNELWAIDYVLPSVEFINITDANPTNAATVNWEVRFTEGVDNVDITDFSLAASGIAGAAITAVTPITNRRYTVTATTGTGQGTLGLNLVDDDSITDRNGSLNPLGGIGIGNGNFTGQVYAIDKIAPVVLSIVRLGPSPTNAATVDFLITFSEDVSGVSGAAAGFPDFSLTTVGVSGAAITARTNLTASTTSVTVATGSGDGTIRLNVVDDDSIQDAVGSSLGGSGVGNGDFTSGETYTIDKTAPVAVSITRASVNPTNASNVLYTVTFSESVAGVDASDFGVTTTGSIAGAFVAGVAGGGNSYSVTVDTGSGSGDIRLDVVDDDSIVDQVLQPLGGSGAGNGGFVSGETYTIDKTMPAVESIVRLNTTPTNSSSVDFLVTFTENVSGVGTADFALTTTGVIGASIVSRTNLTPSTTSVTVNTGTGDGSIRLDLVDDDSIQDAVGNPLGGPGAGNGNYTAGSQYTVDKTPPVVQTILRSGPNPTSAATVDFLVTFSEDVSGVTVPDFALTTTGVSGASIVSRTNLTPNTTRVTVDTGTGNGTIRLDVTDDDSILDTATNTLGGTGAGNGDFSSGEGYDIDKNVPVVQSVLRVDADPTNAAIVSYSVNFSEAVTGVDTTDFSLALGTKAITGAFVDSVAGGPTNYTVTVNTGTGDGTLRLDVVDDDSIVNGVLTPLGGAGAGNGAFASGETYIIDTTAPSVVIGAPSVSTTVSGPVTYTVAFTGADNVNLTVGDITLISTGTATGVVGTSGSGTASRTVTISGITGEGTLSIGIASGVATDAAGNSSSLVGPSASFDVTLVPALPVNWSLLLVAMLVAGLLAMHLRRVKQDAQE